MTAHNRLVLSIIDSDRTFERAEVRGREVWVGKCLHCDTHLVVGLDGSAISRATVEHILPRTAGGTDDLANLALACASCNNAKGARWDSLVGRDPKADEIVEKLRKKREKRTRKPD